MGFNFFYSETEDASESEMLEQSTDHDVTEIKEQCVNRLLNAKIQVLF